MKTVRGGPRAKIVAWFLIPAAAISIGVALLTFFAYQRVTEDLVLARNQDRTLLLANQPGAELAGYAQPLMAVDSAGRIEMVALQESWYADVQRFDGGLLILDPAGKIVDSAPRRSEIAGRQASALIYGAANIANEGSGQDSRDPLSLASGEAHSRLESRPETEGGN